MGNIYQKVLKKIKGIKDVNVLICGLDCSGKTTILYKLKLGFEFPLTTIPTVGINVESIMCKNINLILWDIGGADRIREIFLPRYYLNSSAVIWVIDSTDVERLEEAKKQFDLMLNKSSGKKVPIIVFANKQDLNNALSPEEIAMKLDLERFNDRIWNIIGTSGSTGEGLMKGLNCLAAILKNYETE